MWAKTKWENLLESEAVKVSISKTGSPMTRKIPFVKGEVSLKGSFALSEVVDAMHEPEFRT